MTIVTPLALDVSQASLAAGLELLCPPGVNTQVAQLLPANSCKLYFPCDETMANGVVRDVLYGVETLTPSYNIKLAGTGNTGFGRCLDCTLSSHQGLTESFLATFLANRNAFTFRMYLKISTLANDIYFHGVGGLADGTMAMLCLFMADGSIWIFLSKNGTAYTAYDTAAGVITTGAWTEIQVAYQYVADGTSKLDVLVNGVSKLARTDAVGPLYNTTTAGCRLLAYSASGNPFYGRYPVRALADEYLFFAAYLPTAYTPTGAPYLPYPTDSPVVTFANLDAGADGATWDVSTLAVDGTTTNIQFRRAANNAGSGYSYGAWGTLSEVQAQSDPTGRYFSLQARLVSATGATTPALCSGRISVTLAAVNPHLPGIQHVWDDAPPYGPDEDQQGLRRDADEAKVLLAEEYGPTDVPLVGELESTDPGVGNVIREADGGPASYKINSATKIPTFNLAAAALAFEAGRNTLLDSAVVLEGEPIRQFGVDDEGTYETPAVPAVQPQLLSVADIGSGNVTAAWTPGVPGNTGKLYAREVGAASKFWTLIGSGTTSPITGTGLVTSKSYEFIVEEFNGDYSGLASNVIRLYIGPAGSAPWEALLAAIVAMLKADPTLLTYTSDWASRVFSGIDARFLIPRQASLLPYVEVQVESGSNVGATDEDAEETAQVRLRLTVSADSYTDGTALRIGKDCGACLRGGLNVPSEFFRWVLRKSEKRGRFWQGEWAAEVPLRVNRVSMT